MSAAQALAEFTFCHPESIAIGINLRAVRQQYRVYAGLFKPAQVLPVIAWVGFKVTPVIKLLWIDKHTDDGESILLPASLDQRHVSPVQCTHGRYKTQRASLYGGTECLPLSNGCKYFHWP
ncbi:MAG: hypothetical protein IIB78_08095 [Proteobacteria bacterium]|nr:hypothetical protein [Pseudomonadota bacterium]